MTVQNWTSTSAVIVCMTLVVGIFVCQQTKEMTVKESQTYNIQDDGEQSLNIANNIE